MMNENMRVGHYVGFLDSFACVQNMFSSDENLNRQNAKRVSVRVRIVVY